LDHFCGSPLDMLQQAHVPPVLRTPHPDTALLVRPHQCRIEGQDHLPQPAGHTSFDASQDTFGFLGCEGTLLAHVQLPTHQYPQVLFGKSVLHPHIPQLVLIAELAATQMQTLCSVL